jgi:chromosome segregation ATPase
VVSGRGNRARFCQDGKDWGTRNLSCREAESALIDVDSLRDDTSTLDGTSVAALGEQVDRALAPAQALFEALAGIHGQLDTTVAEALAARDAADALAADQQRLRGVAEAGAEDARAAAAEAANATDTALRGRAAAERELDTERNARVEAEQAQQRAEGRTAALKDELERALNRGDAAVARAADLDVALATLTADFAAAQAVVEQERARTTDATARADAAERKLVLDLAAQAAAHQTQLEATEARHRQELAEHRAAAELVRERVEAELRSARQIYDEGVATLQLTINALNRELGGAHLSQAQAVAAAREATERLSSLSDLVRTTWGPQNLPEEVRRLLND